MQLEKMDEFFNTRAKIYDSHMLDDLQLEQFYDEIANCFPKDKNAPVLLDLGVGTGLELERLFSLYLDMSVTGIDLSQGMLDVLRDKYHDKNINTICGSYFDVGFGKDKYDFVLSTYSLHHFSEEKKLELYKKVYSALRTGGNYIEGDYTCKTQEEQDLYIKENERLRSENNITEGFYHYDTPFTVETQIKLLKAAGFGNVQLVKEWDNTSIIVADKRI
jgi:tRNA (cmo5U34)-methyltransferase